MKTSVKWLIAALILIFIGVLVFVFTMTRNNWKYSAASKTEFETRIVETAGKFDNITITSDIEDIVFVPSDNGRCRVVFYDSKDVQHNVNIKDGTLLIERADKGKWYDLNLSFSYDTPSITVCLPRSEYNELFIKGSTGDIDIPGNFTFRNINIDMSTGDIECHASASGLIKLEASTGDIELSSASAGNVFLKVSTGRIEAGNINCKGTFEVNVSTGRAEIKNVSCNTFSSDGSTGRISLENIIAAESIEIERSTGDVTFKNCDASEISVKTNTGDITGTLRSEKVFIAKSGTGDVKVPETITGGKCKLISDTGDISIRIGQAI